VLGEVLGVQARVGGAPAFHGVDDVPTPAVVGGHVEGDGVVVHGSVLRGFDALLQFSWKSADVAQHFQAHAFGLHGLHFFFKVLDEQAHQGGHLVTGAAPVFGAEGKQGEVAHTLVGTGFDQVSHASRAFGMAHGARHVALLGPATIAVHDDGHVLRQVGRGKMLGVVHNEDDLNGRWIKTTRHSSVGSERLDGEFEFLGLA